MNDNLTNNNNNNDNEYKIKVLLIDDQTIVIETIKRMLASENDITFHYCQDSSEAVKFASELGPTVILQDLMMPDVNGFDLIKYYRMLPKLKEVPIIVLSSRFEPETKAEAFSLGANDYMVKPDINSAPDKIELIARIRYHSNSYINLLKRNDAYIALDKSKQELVSEISKAANYVKSLMPDRFSNEKISTDWEFIPSIQLGGDSFGYYWLDDNNFVMYLLDVCGHGVGPALLSVSALNSIRSQSLPNADYRNPEQVLSVLNDMYQMDTQNEMYFTIWYGVYNTKTRELSYASGGHPPALLINSEKKIDKLITENFIIGGMPSFPYTSNKIYISPNSTLYVFSDGVYEVEKPNGEMMTLEEMAQFIVEFNDNSKSEIMELYKYLQNLGRKENLDDDFTMFKVFFK